MFNFLFLLTVVLTIFPTQKFYAAEAVQFDLIDENGLFDDHSKIIDNFFKLVKENKSSEAIDFLFMNNVWFHKNPDQVVNLKNQFSGLLTAGTMGKFIDFEKIIEKDFFGKMISVFYIIRFEREPLLVNFKFYKSGDKWQTFYFKFNEDIDDLLDQQILEKLKAN